MDLAIGAIVGAVIAGTIAVFLKVYDNYNNKELRELKNILDIQKNLNSVDSKITEEVKRIVNIKARDFINEEITKEKWKKAPKGSEAKLYLNIFGLMFSLAAVDLLIIAIIFFCLGEIGDLGDFLIPAGVLIGISILIGKINYFIKSRVIKSIESKDQITVSSENKEVKVTIIVK